MKKRLYLQPAIEIIGILPLQLMEASRGWSKDGNPPFTVEQEEEVQEKDKLPSVDLWDDGGYGGFLDLD